MVRLLARDHHMTAATQAFNSVAQVGNQKSFFPPALSSMVAFRLVYVAHLSHQKIGMKRQKNSKGPEVELS